MNRFLLDVNTLIALLDPRHVFHDGAHRWLEKSSKLRWLTCPLVQNGFLRVVSQSSYPNQVGTTQEARTLLQQFCKDPRHEFCPDNISLLTADILSRPEKLTPSRITDLYLLALAQHNGVRLASFDRGIPTDAVPKGHDSFFLIPS